MLSCKFDSLIIRGILKVLYNVKSLVLSWCCEYDLRKRVWLFMYAVLLASQAER